MAIREDARLSFVRVKDAYTYFAFATLLVSMVAPLQIYFNTVSSLLYSATPVIGLALIAYGVIKRRFDLSHVGMKALIILLVGSLVSCAVNYRYDPIGNIKATCWMAIPIFLLYCPAKGEAGERRLHSMLVGMIPLSLVLGLLCGVSIVQLFMGYGAAFENPNSPGILRCGYIDGRLFGIFTDPNYAALCALLLACVTFVAFQRKRLDMPLSIACGISVFLQLTYVVLSESRGAVLCMIAAATFLGFFLARYRLSSAPMPKGRHARAASPQRGSRVKATVLSLAIALCCAAVVYGVYTVYHRAWFWVMDTIGTPAIESTKDGGTQIVASTPNGAGGTQGSAHVRPDAVEGTDMSNNRFTIWADGITIWKSAPLFGATPRGYLDYAAEKLGDLFIVARQYSLHSAPVSLLVFTGILGTAAALVWLVQAAFCALRYLFQRLDAGRTSYVCVAILAASVLITIVDSLILSGIFFATHLCDFVFWSIAGMCVSMASEGLLAPEEAQ